MQVKSLIILTVDSSDWIILLVPRIAAVSLPEL